MSTRVILRAEPDGYSESSGYILPYIPIWAIIQTFSISKYYTSSIVLTGWVILEEVFPRMGLAAGVYRQISTVGEIDCPNPKQFNSPLTQNPILILERILSDKWCLDATFYNWPQVSSMFRKKKFFWKPINQTQIFNCGRKRPWRPAKKRSSYWKFIEVTHSRMSGRGRRSGVINILLKHFSLIPDLVHGPTASPCWFLFIQSWSSHHQVHAGKRYNSNPNSTKRF